MIVELGNEVFTRDALRLVASFLLAYNGIWEITPVGQSPG
jgi:hypothetical protein